MSGAAFLRIKKLKGGTIIAVAARHNKREMYEGGSIDPARTCLNECIAGPRTADDVAMLAKSLMSGAGIEKSRRKDAVMCIEVVFSLPPNHHLDDSAYFADCAKWAAGQFGGVENVLSVDIHRDEGAPHCHVLILPLVNGRLNGGKLVLQYSVLQNRFHGAVAARYGLRKAPARLQGASKQAAATLVLDRLRTTADAALQSAAWATIRDTIENDPTPWLVSLGIVAPTTSPKPMKTVVQIFTSPGKGGKTEREEKSVAKSIDFQQSPKSIDIDAQEKGQSLCSVDFQKSSQSLCTQSAPLEPSPTPRPDRMEIGLQAIKTAIERNAMQSLPSHTPVVTKGPDAIRDGPYTRVRDGDQLPGDW